MKWFGAKTRQNESIGVEFAAGGVAFAHIVRSAKQEPQLVHCEFIPCENPSDAPELLRARLLKLGLHRAPCHVCLSPGHYQLILGEAPKVPPEELADALRWRIKDLIQFPIADAVIDAFLLAEDSARGSNRLAYAVVSQRQHIEQLIAQAKSAHLNLQAIDIPELVLRNLVVATCDTKRGVAFVTLSQGGGSLHIIRDGNLYLSRQFSLAYNGGLLDDLPVDALALELQRSLDYFERQMRQSPPSSIYVCGENVTPDKMTPTLRNSLAVTIELYSIQSGIQLSHNVQEHTLSLCLLALGAALREDAVGAT